MDPYDPMMEYYRPLLEGFNFIRKSTNELKNGKIIMKDRIEFEKNNRWPTQTIEKKIERIWPIRYKTDPVLDIGVN